MLTTWQSTGGTTMSLRHWIFSLNPRRPTFQTNETIIAFVAMHLTRKINDGSTVSAAVMNSCNWHSKGRTSCWIHYWKEKFNSNPFFFGICIFLVWLASVISFRSHKPRAFNARTKRWGRAPGDHGTQPSKTLRTNEGRWIHECVRKWMRSFVRKRFPLALAPVSRPLAVPISWLGEGPGAVCQPRAPTVDNVSRHFPSRSISVC